MKTTDKKIVIKVWTNLATSSGEKIDCKRV